MRGKAIHTIIILIGVLTAGSVFAGEIDFSNRVHQKLDVLNHRYELMNKMRAPGFSDSEKENLLVQIETLEVMFGKQKKISKENIEKELSWVQSVVSQHEKELEENTPSYQKEIIRGVIAEFKLREKLLLDILG